MTFSGSSKGVKNVDIQNEQLLHNLRIDVKTDICVVLRNSNMYKVKWWNLSYVAYGAFKKTK